VSAAREGEPQPKRGSGRLPVLYAIACGSPAASYLGRLVTLAHQAGWQPCVIATPDGCKFIDLPALAEQTGYPVRSDFKSPDDPDVLPPADAIVVAPATVNTVNKWACGMADTLALGLLIEAYGLGLPTVAMPYTNTAMAAHPTFHESLRRLRSWGVEVLFGEEVLPLPPPGSGARRAAEFPWQRALAALGEPRLAAPDGRGHPGARYRGADRAGMAANRVRLAPPVTPRPAPAILRTH
jgi:hypothetical protein